MLSVMSRMFVCLIVLLDVSQTAGAASVTLDGSVEYQTVQGGSLYYNAHDGNPHVSLQ
jgi:hypothetical protein